MLNPSGYQFFRHYLLFLIHSFHYIRLGNESGTYYSYPRNRIKSKVFKNKILFVNTSFTILYLMNILKL